MVGGDDEHVAPADADLRGAQAGGRVRLRARRPGRRRALREDGPQRHRVRADARLRRGLRAAARPPSWSTDVPGVIKSWREGTVVRSWLLDLLDRALDEDPELAELRGYADDTGEGRWTVEEAIRLAVPMNVIAASLFARFASRQDDSPAMKAVAALRNQFGGHAVKQATDDVRPAARAGRLPLVRAGRASTSTPGVERARRPERGRQDQPGRGARATWRRSAATGSPPTRRWSGPAPQPAVIRCAIVHDGPRAAGRAGDRAGQGQPGPARPVAGHAGPATSSARCGWCCSRRRTWSWCAATRPSAAATSTTCWSPRQPRFAGRAGRLRAGAQAAQRPAAHAPTWPARSAAPRRGDLSTLDVWDAHLAQHGAELLAGRLELVAALAPHVAKAYDAVAAGRGAAAIAYTAVWARSPMPDRVRRWRPALLPSLAESPHVRGGAGRHAGRPAPRRPDADAGRRCRPRGTPATASRGRSRWRCGWPRTTCCAPTASSRCWCSTTCSPSWTPAGGSGWPTWSAAASQVLVTCAVDDDVPAVAARAPGTRSPRGRCAVPDELPPTSAGSAGDGVDHAGAGRRGAGPGRAATPRRPGAMPAVRAALPRSAPIVRRRR